MDKLFFSIILLFLSISCKAQRPVQLSHSKDGIIKMPAFYSGSGIILKVDSSELPGVKNYAKLYNPTDSDLVRSERLLKAQFIALINERNGNQSFNPVRDKDLYKDWDRQYVAFTDNNNDNIIFIELFNCCHHNMSTCFPAWKTKLIFLLDGDPCTKDARYLVNLSKNTISIF